MLSTAWSLLRESGLVLLEGTPRDLDSDAVGRALARHPGVIEVHDLHVWEVTSGFPALAAHVLVAPGDDCHRIRRELELLLEDRFSIGHTTLQVEHERADALLEIDSEPKRGLARHEQQRRRHRAPARLGPVHPAVRVVAQAAAADQRGRAAAVEVDRRVAAEVGHQPRELLQRQAASRRERPSQTTANRRPGRRRAPRAGGGRR